MREFNEKPPEIVVQEVFKAKDEEYKKMEAKVEEDVNLVPPERQAFFKVFDIFQSDELAI